MITYERTHDWALIKEIVSHPKIYPAVSDDYSSAAEDWIPVQADSFWYIAVRNDGELLGMWIFQMKNAICWDTHTCLLPNAWGPVAREAVLGMVQWIWDNTPCIRLVTEVPEYNRLALRFAKSAGMKEYGINQLSYRKCGKLHDVILLGMSKPGVE